MSLLTVKRVASLADVTSDTIRHYVKIGLLSPSRDEGNNYKLFTQSDVKRVRFIRRAQQLGFNLTDIRVFVEQNNKEQSSVSRDAKKLIQTKMNSIRQTVVELNKLHQYLEQTVSPDMMNHQQVNPAVVNIVDQWDR